MFTGEMLQGLGRGDAEFVGETLFLLLLLFFHSSRGLCQTLSISDVIHSDAGGLGKAEAIGDAGQHVHQNNWINRLIPDSCLIIADFFPNGIVPLMPGCFTIFCSHSRAWEYFAETVVPGNEGNYVAKKCGSLYSYEINACTRKEVIMGFACPNNTKGNFFLKTNSKAPFGQGKQQQKQWRLLLTWTNASSWST